MLGIPIALINIVTSSVPGFEDNNEASFPRDNAYMLPLLLLPAFAYMATVYVAAGKMAVVAVDRCQFEFVIFGRFEFPTI